MKIDFSKLTSYVAAKRSISTGAAKNKLIRYVNIGFASKVFGLEVVPHFFVQSGRVHAGRGPGIQFLIHDELTKTL